MPERGPGSHLFDDEGRRYSLGELLAEGGEGRIHDLVGQPGTIVKVLHLTGRSGGPERQRDMAAKIAHMLQYPPRAPEGLPGDAGHPYWAWPERRLRAADGSFAGYLMPKLAGVKGEEFHLFGSGYAWDARLAAARDVARLVVATHEAGYVIGDLNPRNLFFTPLAADAGDGARAGGPSGSDASRGGVVGARPRVVPSLIDTDSFQVDDPAGGPVPLFECRVQNPEYSAPELIDGTTRVRTQQQDAFALAIVVFQALALGVHPFSGVARGSPIREIRSNIARRQNLLLSRELVPPKGMIDLAVLPPAIRACFERTFGAGHLVTGARVAAAEWVEVLSGALDTELIDCDRVPNHVYGRHQPTCPWCGYARALGADPFVALPAGERRRRPVAPQVLQTREGADRIAAGRRPMAPPAAPARMGPGAPDDTIFGPVPPSLRSGSAAPGGAAPGGVPPGGVPPGGVPPGGVPPVGAASGGPQRRPAPAGDDTIFGPVPADLGADPAGAAGPAPAPRPATAPPAPTPPAPTAPGPPAPATPQTPGGAIAAAGPPAAAARAPLVKPWLVVTLLLGAVLGVLWFGLGSHGRQAVATRVQSWLGGLGAAERNGPVEVPIFTPGASRGSHSLTIELCVDRAPPYACSGATQPLRGVEVAILGSRGVERRAATTLEGMRVFYARDLPADRYTITLIDTTGERLLERYTWCDGVGPGGAALGAPISMRLDRDRTLALVLCPR